MRRGWGASLIKESETRNQRLARNDIEAVVVQIGGRVVHKPRRWRLARGPNLGSWSKSEVVVQIEAVVVQIDGSWSKSEVVVQT